jgi:RAT1-interacting protein
VNSGWATTRLALLEPHGHQATYAIRHRRPMGHKRKADDLEKDNSVRKRPRRSPPPPSGSGSGSPIQQKIPTHSLKLPQRDSSQHSVAFQKPSIITTFSYTPNRELAFDNSAIKYFVQPPARADLGYRYSGWTRRPEEKGRLDSLLRAVAKSGLAQSLPEAAVSWRGVMCKYAALFNAHI